MKTIVRKPVPYGDIPKLPELREKFMNAYTKILDAESAPVLDSIDQDRERVLEVIDTKPYRDSKRERYLAQFSESDRARRNATMYPLCAVLQIKRTL